MNDHPPAREVNGTLEHVETPVGAFWLLLRPGTEADLARGKQAVAALVADAQNGRTEEE